MNKVIQPSKMVGKKTEFTRPEEMFVLGAFPPNPSMVPW
jgi:hypothetical protein